MAAVAADTTVLNLCLVRLDADDLRRTTLCAFTASDAPFRVDNRSRREQLGCFLHCRSKKGWKVAGKIHRFGLRVDKVGNGQRQRIGLARALILDPKIVVCDEPVSALDVSIQSQIINLLKELQRKRGLTYLFVAHDMSVIRYISDRVGVMYLGHLVEEGDTDEVFDHPQHPYTRTLMSAVPSIDPRDNRQRILLEGDLPSPIDPPSGCVFHTRCPWATEACKTASCELREVRKGHYAACSRGEQE